MLFDQGVPHFLLYLLVLVHSFVNRCGGLFPAVGQFFTTSVQPGREEFVFGSISSDSFEVLLLLGLEQNFLPEDAHVVELLVDQRNLFVIEREGLPMAKLLDGVELIDDQGVPVLLVDDVQTLAKFRLLDWVDVALLRSVVEDSAANLEEVLGDILSNAVEVALFGVDEQLFLLLVQDGIHLDRLRPDLVLVHKVQVAEHLHDEDLV